MNLNQKLIYRSTFLFLITIALIVVGTYWLYRYETEEAYKKKLLGIAHLAGEFYLEKDEVNPVAHQRIEKNFNKISDVTIRLYRVNDKTVYIDDVLDTLPTDKILAKTVENHLYTFKKDDRVFLCLFYGDNQGDFVIVVSGVNAEGRKRVNMLVEMLAVFALAGLILHVFLTRILAKSTFKPFATLIGQVNSIKSHDWHKRLPYTNNSDEVNQFIREFNYLLDRLESGFTIQRNFLRNASHEIKTPLAIIIGDIEVALSNARTNEEYRELLASLRANSLHLKSVFESLITLSNLEVTYTNVNEDVRVDEVLWDILDKKRIEYPDRTAVVEFLSEARQREGMLVVPGNRHLLFIAIGNIIDNAFKFSQQAPIQIRFNVLDGKLQLQIADNGPGIAAAEREHIFKLFYRTPQNNHIPGHGIGLYLTRQILELHAVEIIVGANEPTGTVFTLVFPHH